MLNKNKSRKVPKAFTGFKGTELIDKIIDIDQSPIGRTPRSNPATYTGAFGPIREWFAALPESKARGYKVGRYSFNVKGGRCETCEGDGVLTYEMHFLPDVFIPCDTCKGARYNRETLEIRFKNKNIADVLDMTVDEGCEFFENIQSIRSKLITLKHVGLGYMKIGQQATTLSGGEAQRIKLAKELSKRPTGRTLYILDEPTTGLHSHDIKKLLEILQAFANTGNTVVVIEHNLDVIKTADHIIDMGPEGGINGGRIIAEGTPEKVSTIKESYTGKFMENLLEPIKIKNCGQIYQKQLSFYIAIYLFYRMGLVIIFFSWLFNTLILTGIMWIGLLWYFNFVQIPSMPNIPDEQKPAIGKVIAPKALFWFRWAALGTIITGLIVSYLQGYVHQAMILGIGSGDPKTTAIGIGMWLGIIMAYNVWFVIWPNQKKALGLVDCNPEEKAKSAKTAMLFSRTNTLLSFPMLLSMVAAQNLY